ncbi:helix-turn-helix domain-containing protein [Limibacter armeniacum]|uniref:helix-turn-helix domain-containing protein n=1 Tax=Limibacter armeniacum TaxID=466084 RepID=UPI002FE5B0D8
MKPQLTLTPEDRSKLEKLYKYDTSSRVRLRSHAVLLYAQGFNFTQLTEILQVNKIETVSRWIQHWQQHGFSGLYDSKPQQHPRKSFKASEEKKSLIS